MRHLTIIFTLFALTTFFNFCFIGAGTHGHIKDYSFKNSNEEIVSIVDDFLLNNPKYFDSVDNDFGWINIKIPTTNEKFCFRIGGQHEIVLLAAGYGHEKLKFDKDLGLIKEKRLSNIFEKNFIDKLKGIKPNKIKLLKNPFILSSNKNIDTVFWPHYVIKCDTLLTFPLPFEFDTLDISFFKDLVSSYLSFNNNQNEIIQYFNIFRINHDYSGYISDSIYITAVYRNIGQPKEFNCLFNQEEWKKYLSKNNISNRMNNYKLNRNEQVKKGYTESDVYSEIMQELWMVQNNNIVKKKAN